VELVGSTDEDKAAARLKFRFYRDRGYDIKSTDVRA
jgi:DNA polymerase-3 subunit chi